MIRRDRGRRGGGVAICYDPTKLRLKKFPVGGDGSSEIVCATGNVSLTKQKLALISVYIPPSVNGVQLDNYIYTLVELADSIKVKFPDAIIYMGGDFNRKEMERFCTAFPDIKPIEAGATRNGLAMDEIYTNVGVKEKTILPPLSKRNGVRSDHSIIVATSKLPRQCVVRKTSFSFRPLTTEGVTKFGLLLDEFDWNVIAKESSTLSAAAFDQVLTAFIAECFPLKHRKIRSNDAPWFDAESRRAVRRKKRIYKREGKSENYHRACKDCARVILAAKKKFWGNVLDKTARIGNSRPYYGAVKLFSTKHAPEEWDVGTMYPGSNDEEICEALAVFFNRISQEYPALPNPKRITEVTDILQAFEVSARLKGFKKPKSRVAGDIPPELVTRYHDKLAVPLTYVYNQALSTLEWPELWKSETVSLIPKNNSPTGPSELRNLSCTPLFSKVLESLVLDKLKEETSLSRQQYGGIRGCSTEHFLLDTWNNVIEALEDGSAANLVSIASKRPSIA